MCDKRLNHVLFGTVKLKVATVQNKHSSILVSYLYSGSGEGCDILQSMAESTGPLGCFMADDRQGLLCPLHVPGAQDGVLQVKVLECEEPMAVVLSLLNSSRELFTYTFHQTGGIDLPIAGTKASLYITLDHLRDTVLGVKVCGLYAYGKA